MGHGFRFENAMFGIEIFRRPRNRPPSNGFGRELRYPLKFFDGDSENRNPEADVGLSKIEKSTFHVFAKMVAQICSKRFRVRESPGLWLVLELPRGF